MCDYNNEHNPRSFIDLDTIEIGESPQSDIHFFVGGGNTVIWGLILLNGARSKSMGAENIDLATCRTELNSFDEDVRFQLRTGNHICVFSNRNRFFLLRIEDGFYSASNAIYTLRLFIKTDNL